MMLIDKIREYIGNEISNAEFGEITDQDDLLGNGIIDSMGMMRLIDFIEKETGIQIPQEDMTVENFMTIENIGGYLGKRKDIDLKEDRKS